MRVLESVLRQFHDVGVADRDRELVRVRVTPEAIPGSLVAMPLTPERARTLGRESEYERLIEIVVSPGDWREILTQVPKAGASAVTDPDISPALYGVPVVIEE